LCLLFTYSHRSYGLFFLLFFFSKEGIGIGGFDFFFFLGVFWDLFICFLILVLVSWFGSVEKRKEGCD